jgi:Cu-processing system permease protein
MSATLALAGWELRTAVRTRWVLATSLVFAASCLVATFFGLRSLRSLGLAGAGAVADGLVNLGVLLPPLLGLMLGAGSLAGMRERGMLALLASQPVRRATLVRSTFLGLTATLWISVLLGFGAAGLVVAGVAQGSDLPAVAALVLATLAVSATAVAVGVALSTLSSSRGQASAAAVCLWFVLAFGVDLLLAGVAPGLRLGPRGLLLAVLANPLEAARMAALFAAAPDGSTLGPFGAYLADRFGAVGTLSMLAGALLAWTVLPLSVATRTLRRRDI